MSSTDIWTFFRNLEQPWKAMVIIAMIVIGIGIWSSITEPEKRKAQRIKERPEGINIKFAEGKHERSSSLAWRNMPAAVNSEIVARELGWTLGRYKLYQDTRRKEVLTADPDLGNELHPQEIILNGRYGSYPYSVSRHNWSIILTDKRILYKFEEKELSGAKDSPTTLQLIASHWYANIVEVKPEWSGDLGSHVAGGGGYIQGWAWQGTGSTWGQQNPIYTIQHQMSCILTVREKNGEWQKFPFLYMSNEDGLNAVKGFVGMLEELVNLAWKRPDVEISSARVEVPAPNPKLIEAPADGSKTPSGEKGETGDFEKRIATLERYAALREKGLITEEEYNQQKKKLVSP